MCRVSRSDLWGWGTWLAVHADQVVGERGTAPCGNEVGPWGSLKLVMSLWATEVRASASSSGSTSGEQRSHPL